MENEVPKKFVDIKIIGVGGGGCNAVNRLSTADINGVEFIAANTDASALDAMAKVENQIILGKKLTKGLGAGSKPEIGEQATKESKDEIINAITGADLLFITAGMGGGTGTGGAPVIAEIAHELNILTIAVVTKPFHHEGNYKMKLAEAGIAKLKKHVDVLVVIPNEKAFEFAPDATMLNIYQIADDVLHNSIVGITEIVVRTSLVNLDFADIETVIRKKGTAHIGIGRAKGENRVLNALRQAANSPLLESNIDGATQIIVNILADPRVTGIEVNNALSLITDVAYPDANIIHGIGFDPNLDNEVIITLIATGFKGEGSEADGMTKNEGIIDAAQLGMASPYVTAPNKSDGVPNPRLEVPAKDIPPFMRQWKAIKKDGE